MTRRLAAGLLVLALASLARAHDAPIPPGDCVFETISVEVPASGLRADAAPAGAADEFRILFDTSANAAQFATGALPARLLAGGMTGTLAFRSLFDGRLRANGQLVAEAVPLTLVLDGGSANVRVTLATGLAAANGTMVEGAPFAADGSFTLVGVTSSDQLLSGATVILRLAGRATPVPDLDGFALAPLTKRVSGKLAAGTVRVRAVIEVPVGVTPDFGGRATALRISSVDTTVGSVLLPAGLAASGRRFVAERDGVTVTVSTLRKKPVLTHALDVAITQPLATPDGGQPITLTYDVGGLMDRGTGPLRGRWAGALILPPSPVGAYR